MAITYGGVTMDIKLVKTEKVYDESPLYAVYRQWWLLQQFREASFRYFQSRQRDEPEADTPIVLGGE